MCIYSPRKRKKPPYPETLARYIGSQEIQPRRFIREPLLGVFLVVTRASP